MDFIELSSKKPRGLEEDPRLLRLGVDSKFHHKPVGSFSAFPENRVFTLGSRSTVKTATVDVLKAEDVNKSRFKGTHGSDNKRGHVRVEKWLMSEKLDGLRWVWDGSHFITTSGCIPHYVPGWVKELMPIGVPLDGELWGTRDGFNNVTGISTAIPGGKYSRTDLDHRWLEFSFNAFDVPSHSGRFEDRVSIMKRVIEIRVDFWPKIQKKYYKILKETDKELAKKFKNIECPLRMVEQLVIKNEKHLEKYFDNIIGLGGEGLIVRDPKSFYERGRRPKIALKYKKQADAEAEVIDILRTDEEGSRLDYMITGPDGNEYPVMGKILCRLTDSQGNPIKHDGKDVQFKIGTGFSDEFRENYCNPEKPDFYIWNHTIKKGAIITFRYMEFNKENGVPRLPRYLRIRHSIKDKHETLGNLEPSLPETGNELKYRLIRDLRVVALVAQNRSKTLSGRDKMSNTFRIKVYERAIEAIESMSDGYSFKKAKKFLREHLTKAPREKMEMMLEKGFIQLDKEPYKGVTIINGEVDDIKLQKEIEAVIIMEPLLNAKVGIGSNLLQQLIDLDYTSIESLKDFENDKRMGKALTKALKKYFEGSIRTVPRMTRSQAKCWRKTINKKLKEIKREYPTLKFKMAGSYARKSETVGDIDYVVCHDGNYQDMYDILMKLLSSMEKSFKIEIDGSSQRVNIEQETLPKKKKPSTNSSIGHLEVRLSREGSPHKRKLEVYGYCCKKRDYLFAFLDRTASVKKQKELRWKSHDLGLSLSGKGFKNKNTGKMLKPGDKLIRDRLGKDYFETFDDVYKFVGVSN